MGKRLYKGKAGRGIASISWRMQFQKAEIYHLGAINSDHSPLLLGDLLVCCIVAYFVVVDWLCW